MKVLLLVIVFAATVSPVGNTEGKGSICMCVMIREGVSMYHAWPLTIAMAI